MSELHALVAAFTPVPSLGGVRVIAYLAAAALLGGLAAWSLVRRERSFARTTQAVAVALLIVAGLTRLPSELSTRHTQWTNQRGYDAAGAEAEVQRSYGVEPAFLEFANRKIAPGASFTVFIGPAVKSSAAHSWLQWALMPRIEEYGLPCRAEWIVLFGLEEPPGPIKIASRTAFAPGYSVARNEAPCES